jgi:hypothetical protein
MAVKKTVSPMTRQ